MVASSKARKPSIGVGPARQHRHRHDWKEGCRSIADLTSVSGRRSRFTCRSRRCWAVASPRSSEAARVVATRLRRFGGARNVEQTLAVGALLDLGDRPPLKGRGVGRRRSGGSALPGHPTTVGQVRTATLPIDCTDMLGRRQTVPHGGTHVATSGRRDGLDDTARSRCCAGSPVAEACTRPRRRRTPRRT